MENKELGNTVVEIRIPWVCSIAWKTLLKNTSVSESCFNEKMLFLSDQFQQIIPDWISKSLQKFHKTADTKALIIRNCPIDDLLPPTPYAGHISPAQLPISSLTNLALYTLLGIKPIVYQGENFGSVFRHVVPAHNKTSCRSSHGSLMDFGYHVDNPDLPLASEPIDKLSGCPEFLSLFGIRCDPRVKTTLVDIEQALALMPEKTIKELGKPQFTIHRPQSFSNAKKTTNLPLIVKDKSNEWLCRFDTENTEAETAEGNLALDALRASLKAKGLQREFLLLPGDFLIFKNQKVVHARNSFSPLNDGVDRWLMRLFGTSDPNRVLKSNSGIEFEVTA